MSKSILLALMFVFSHAAAAAAAPALAKPAEPPPIVDSIVLLDPDSKPADRSRQLELLQGEADKRAPWAMYMLGTLYRLGDAHPAKGVPRDLDKARIYLSNAAILGSVPPMAGMAELELEAHRPLEALTWAYIYLYFSRGEGALKKEKVPLKEFWQGDGYDVDLLARALKFAEDAGIERRTAGDHAEVFVAKYKGIIQDAMAKAAAESADEPQLVLATSSSAMVSRNRQARVMEVATSTTATFLLLFAADGKPLRIVVQDILPGKRGATIEPLFNIARRARSEPRPAGSAPKLARMPVSFVSDNRRLK